MINENLFNKIQLDGANARAIGISTIFDNPYYRLENMPGQTGELHEHWQAKALAWEIGYKMEDLIRS